MAFAAEVRDEIARLPVRPDGARLAETAALVRCAGTLRLRGGGGTGHLDALVTVREGAVARRLRAAVADLTRAPEIEVHRRGNLDRGGAFRLAVGPAALAALGLLAPDGRPRAGLPPGHAAHPVASVAGALMAAGSVSAPGRPAHLEIRAPGERTAQDVAALLEGAAVSGTRVAVKSGARIAEVLARLGAHRAFLAWEEGRLRRELRGAANRAANADRANARRASAAAARQVAAVQRAVDAVGWGALPDELRDVALARLANPSATLAELGALLEPPVGKVTVRRRVERLAGLGERPPSG